MAHRRIIIRSSASEVPHRAPRGTRLNAIGDTDAGARDLRAHDLRRAYAKARGARKRVANALAELVRRDYDPRALSRTDARIGFDLGIAIGDAVGASTAAGAMLWIASAGKERASVRDYIIGQCQRIVRSRTSLVRDFARSLSHCVMDHTIIGDLYAMVTEARALREGIAPASVLVTNNARVAGTAYQRVWDARTRGTSASRAKQSSHAVQTRNHALTLSDNGIGGLDASSASDAGQSRSARILAHARTGDPTVSLGCVDMDDACRIVRMIDRDRGTDRLALSSLRGEVSSAAWHIAICALRHDLSLARFARAAKSIARKGKSSFAIPMPSTAPIAARSVEGITVSETRPLAPRRTPRAVEGARIALVRAHGTALNARARTLRVAKAHPCIRTGLRYLSAAETEIKLAACLRGHSGASAHTGPMDTAARDCARVDNPPVSGG